LALNEDMIVKTSKDINDTIYYLEKAIISLKQIRDDLPMTSFMHMAKIEQVNKLVEGLK
tara:strand:- start:284 stop:460 length:177 start_codon:yes stop_codon:yes gene_type:complete